MTGPTGQLEQTPPGQLAGAAFDEPAPRYLAIGQIVRAHGVRGEVLVTVLTDFPERFDFTEWVYLGDQFEADAYLLKAYRWHNKSVLLTLDGIDNRDAAQTLSGQLVQIPLEEAMPLPEGDFYLYQLVGLQVVTTAGEPLGVLDHIIETGANDVYVVKTEHSNPSEVLIPAIPEVVKEVDLENKQMTIALIDGLI